MLDKLLEGVRRIKKIWMTLEDELEDWLEQRLEAQDKKNDKIEDRLEKSWKNAQETLKPAKRMTPMNIYWTTNSSSCGSLKKIWTKPVCLRLGRPKYCTVK